MCRKENNIKVVAENAGQEHGFNIFIDFSGQREYLMYHRHNGLLYNELKNGKSLGDMKRWKANNYRGRRSMKLERMMDHLNKVVDNYLVERAA